MVSRKAMQRRAGGFAGPDGEPVGSASWSAGLEIQAAILFGQE
jgi:hypothetical protein